MSQWIAGVDEVGRGPLAGPVVAAAVVLDEQRPIAGLADSKKLSEKKREYLSALIKRDAHAWALGRCDAAEIDAMNILQASLLAMARAVAALQLDLQAVWVDGKHAPPVPFPVKTVIGGDGCIAAISAASIVAKVARDQEMIALDAQYPDYGFAKHKGYPTRQHRQVLQERGYLSVHRRSFAPVRTVAPATEYD